MCTHKAHLWVSHFGPEMTILGKIRRNFWVCYLGAPHPKIFSASKVMTLGYIQHKYLSVTRKTRRATEDWILVTLAFSSDYQWGKHPFRKYIHKNTGWKWANFEEVYLCEFCELRWDICAGYSLGSLLWGPKKFWGGVHPGGTPRNFGGFCPKSPFWGQNGKPTNVPCGCTYCTPKFRAEKYFTIPSKSCKNFGSKNLKIFERGGGCTDFDIFWAPGIWAPWYIWLWLKRCGNFWRQNSLNHRFSNSSS